MTINPISNPFSDQTFLQNWHSLVENNFQAPFFSLPLYQEVWWKHLGHGDLQVSEIKNDQDETVGIFPLFKNAQGQVAFIGTLEETDYLDMVMKKGEERTILETFIQDLTEQGVKDLFLACLKRQSLTLRLLHEVARSHGWHLTQEQQTVCPIISLPDTYEKYEQQLDPSFLKQLSKQHRTLLGEGEIEIKVSTPESIDQDINTFITLHKSSGPNKSSFWSPARETFFKELGVLSQKAGYLKLFTLLIDNDPAAVLWIFDWKNEFLLYNSGFNAYRYGHLGAGNYLVAETIKTAIELGRTHYDFMRGDETYKFKFGAVAEPLFNLKITR